MTYRIEYAGERCCKFVHSREDLIKLLKSSKKKNIADIRKVYKTGVTDSVIATYRNYL